MSVSLVKLPTPQGALWVCQGCMLMHANGEDEGRPADMPEPWALWADEPAGSVTMGAAVHGASGTDDECADDDDCECEHVTFATSRCGACGTHLAGDRYAFTYWA